MIFFNRINLKQPFLLLLLIAPYNIFSQCFLQDDERISIYDYYFSYETHENEIIDNVVNELKKSNNAYFDLNVNILFYEDKSPNAFVITNGENGYDGEIFLGETLMEQLFNSAEEKHDWDSYHNQLTADFLEVDHYFASNVFGILIHEYSHILQKKYTNPWEENKWNELQADFMVGAYCGIGIAEAKALEDIGELYKSIYNGDIDLHKELAKDINRNTSIYLHSFGDKNFGSPSHHGTGEEREHAFMAGLKSAINIYPTVFTDDLKTGSGQYDWDGKKIIEKTLRETLLYSEDYINFWRKNGIESQLNKENKDLFIDAVEINDEEKPVVFFTADNHILLYNENDNSLKYLGKGIRWREEKVYQYHIDIKEKKHYVITIHDDGTIQIGIDPFQYNIEE